MSVKTNNTHAGLTRLIHYKTCYVLPRMAVPSTLAGENIDSFHISASNLPTEEQVREFMTDHPHLFEDIVRVYYLDKDTGTFTNIAGIR